MAERRVSVKFSAEVAGYVRAMGDAASATNKTKSAVDEAGKATEQQAQAQEKASKSSQKSEQSSKRTAEQLKVEATAAQDAAKASGLKYDADGRLVDSQGKVLSSAQAAAHELNGFSDAVYLTAEASGEAAPAVENMETRLEGLASKARDAEEAGAALTGFGTAAVAALGASAKAAMDWESAWAGVTKTVDGTPAQMAELEQGLRDLAKELPATHQEIAAVAEAAGQLGVKQADVLGFTKTMIDLGETTNLSADEAATAIAQITNVMGTMEREGSVGVERFASTLVLLGNNGASTEREIVQMAQRIAGAAKLVGASEADLLAMANAMASVGIEAQLGGGVMSRVMQRMYGDVMTGGEGLENLAKIAGVSSEKFAADFANDPVRAVDAVVQGLNRVKEEGGNVIETMSDLGIKGTEETSVLLRLAGAGDILTDSLDQGADAWAANTALVEEAEKRYATTEAQVQMAWNSIKDAAIDAGAVLLPVIATMADGVAGLAEVFGSLPDPVQGVVTTLGGIAGVGALAAGGFILLFPRVMDTVDSFKKLKGIAPDVVAGKLGKAGKLAAGAAAGYALFASAAAMAAQGAADLEADTSVAKFSNALQGAAGNSESAASAINKLLNGVNVTGSSLFTSVDDLAGALDRIYNRTVNDKISDFLGTTFGQNATTGINTAKNALLDLDTALAGLISEGNTADAAEGFNIIKKAAEDQGVSVEELAELFPQYADALLISKTAAGETQVSQDELTAAMQGSGEQAAVSAGMTEEMAEALEEVGISAEGTITNLARFTEALFAAGLAHMSTQEASFAWAETLRGLDAQVAEVVNSQATLGAALDESRSHLNINTDAGKAASDMLIGVAREGLNVASVMANDMSVSQEQVQEQLGSTYDSLIKAHEGLGMLPPEAAAATQELLKIPPNVSVESWMSDAAKQMASDTTAALGTIPGSIGVTVNVSTWGVAAAMQGIAGIAAAAASVGSVSTAPSTPWYEPKHEGAGSSGKFASGGAVLGRGTATSDSIDARLSNGEHVLDAADVQAMGGQAAVYAFRAQLDAGVPASFGGMSAPAREYSAPAASVSAAGGSGGTTIEMPINIYGATDANAVRQAVVGDIKFLMQKNGVRIGD